jgi:hypothetical protein
MPSTEGDHMSKIAIVILADTETHGDLGES